MLEANDFLHVGPGRASQFIDRIHTREIEIAKTMLDDIGSDKKTGDKEFLHTKFCLATRLKEIFGKDGWGKGKMYFPMLWQYWDEQ